MTTPDTIRRQLERVQNAALLAGAAGVVLSLIYIFAFNGWDQFCKSYLFAFIYWVSIPLGCMAILMMHHLTGGWWGYPIRRLLEAGTRTFAPMALLFVPLLFGLSHLYAWAGPVEEVMKDPILAYKRPYMNPSFFTVRTVIYFAIWLLLAFLLNRWSQQQDRTADPKLEGRLEAMSGPGLILWGIAVTYSSVDWGMSIDSHWFSTIYGMVFMVLEALTAMSFVVFVLRALSDEEPLKDAITPQQYNDLGNLMLAFVMLWTYLQFSQFLIIWQANLKDEITWYKVRAFGPWGGIAVVLLVLDFAVPFLLLLQRPVKRRLRSLGAVAGMLVLLSAVDVYWLIVPGFESDRPHFHPIDFFAWIAIGGLWAGAFFWQLKQWPLLPLHDPRFQGALEHEHGD
jgi:hypothetical protein